MTAVAQAQPNIALVKYWGKRDAKLNLPAADSLSITLASLYTRTEVSFDPALEHDTLQFNGADNPRALMRVSACLDALRNRAGIACRASVVTHNNFPTAAGLASSASGFAALVMAASEDLGLPVDRRFLSIAARQGSGSAARSLFGGFVHMHAGQADDGSDAFAEPLLDADAWPLQVVVAVATHQAKSVSSGEGMERGRRTSPFHAAWIDSVDADITLARAAVMARDFQALAEVSEHSCLKMHGVMLSSRPPLMYWLPTTLACMRRVRELRECDGLGTFFTVDAGPQVKAVCLPEDAGKVAAALGEIPGVKTVLISSLGEGARSIPAAEVA
ncbi:MAG TPA: diphosphomevalonate decarboxylase [Rhodanobacteraceae bacterium]